MLSMEQPHARLGNFSYLSASQATSRGGGQPRRRLRSCTVEVGGADATEDHGAAAQGGCQQRPRDSVVPRDGARSRLAQALVRGARIAACAIHEQGHAKAGTSDQNKRRSTISRHGGKSASPSTPPVPSPPRCRELARPARGSQREHRSRGVVRCRLMSRRCRCTAVESRWMLACMLITACTPLPQASPDAIPSVRDADGVLADAVAVDGSCPAEMQRIGSFCIDRYEAYVVEVRDGGERPHSGLSSALLKPAPRAPPRRGRSSLAGVSNLQRGG